MTSIILVSFISGYLGSADTIEAIKVIVQRIKEQNPEAIYGT
jgi:pyridoxal/pyridoxine/pyridoxamine kinase